MKRLAVLTSSFPNGPSDYSGIFVGEHARWLEKQGFPTSVVYLPRTNTFAHGIPDAWQNAFRSSGITRAKKLTRLGLSTLKQVVPYTYRARQTIEEADAIIAHWLIPSVFVAARFAGSRPVLGVAHSGDIWLLDQMGLSNTFVKSIRRHNVRLCFVSEGVRTRFLGVLSLDNRKHIEATSQVCPMGVPPPSLTWAYQGRRRILYVGRLETIKGLTLLIDAVSRLKDVTLTIAGDGSQNTFLEQYALGKNVHCHFLGRVSPQQRNFLMSASDMAIVPSIRQGHREEGFPRVILEALSCGTPTITTLDIDAPVLHATATPEGLSEKIETLLDSKELAQNLSEQGTGWSRDYYWDKIGPRLLLQLFAHN